MKYKQVFIVAISFIVAVVIIKLLTIFSFGMSSFLHPGIVRSIILTVLILFSICSGGYVFYRIYKYLDKEVQ
jgi:hypothetical protein